MIVTEVFFKHTNVDSCCYSSNRSYGPGRNRENVRSLKPQLLTSDPHISRGNFTIKAAALPVSVKVFFVFCQLKECSGRIHADLSGPHQFVFTFCGSVLPHNIESKMELSTGASNPAGGSISSFHRFITHEKK